SIESGCYTKRHAGAVGLNAGQLPAFNCAMTPERQTVNKAEREVVPNIVTASPLVGRAIVRIVPGGGSVISAEAAIGIGEVNAVRVRVGKVALNVVRESFAEAHLQGVVS